MRHSTLYASILFLVLLANWASAQISTEYQPMAVEGAHWICYKAYDKPWGDEYFSWTIRGDTLINNQVYKKMYRDDFFIDHPNQKLSYPPVVIKISLTALIRDDTFQRKVFGIIPPTSGLYRECIIGGQETLLFDFSASVGDTLNSCLLSNLARRSSLLVDSIAYTLYNCLPPYSDHNENKSLKTMNVSGYWESTVRKNNSEIIEGIGYRRYGPFYEHWGGNGGLILEWQKIGGVLCYCVGTDADCNIITSSKEINYLPIRIFPNPVEDRLYFESNNTPFKWLKIYHSSGLLINNLLSISDGKNHIDTHLLQPGHYYLQGLGEDGEIYLGKFIKL